MKLFAIHGGHFACDGGALFGAIPKPLWSKVYPSDDNNVTRLTMRCLLIDQGERKILIEAGVGDHYPDKVKRNNGHEETDALPKSLAAKGYSVDDITDVVFTHLHWDHCNGAVVSEQGELKLLFPNATHWCSQKQWEHSKISNPRERAAYHYHILNFLKEEGRMHLVEDDGELFPGFSVRMYDGHTPGQMIPFIEADGKTYVYMADFIPTAAHVPIVWLAAYDLYPVSSMAEKEPFLKEAADKNYILFFEHDYYTECATVEWTDRGPKLKDKFPF
ncbi:MBL fold metallo-hydrolase [Mangrovibacterium lignilyticum]|uniref:MBL fold metallo-hydrolase n=1 Tax=Mangrovibacterium lignilyticum TaxID=2668052 RepID=UPI0013D3F985|nr:MBL fold metallo-hydrolase [Mangrovibacterium lignilyticum]